MAERAADKLSYFARLQWPRGPQTAFIVIYAVVQVYSIRHFSINMPQIYGASRTSCLSTLRIQWFATPLIDSRGGDFPTSNSTKYPNMHLTTPTIDRFIRIHASMNKNKKSIARVTAQYCIIFRILPPYCCTCRCIDSSPKLH